MLNSEKILVTGGSGLVGYSLRWGYPYGNAIPDANFVSSKDYDLRDSSQVIKMYETYKPEIVIHLAAKVGGVKANTDNPADFFRDNILINTNVLHYAKEFQVKKLISVLSTCIYPNKIDFPLVEENMHNGAPHDSNFAYAYAKRMLDVQSRAYRKQFGCNFITVVLNNLFGENDNYDLNNSHVIPAMIRKIYEAKINNTDVTLWGDGSPLREFTYSGDMAEIILFILENYDGEEPINVGNCKEISIKEVAEMIAKNFDFTNKIIWDINMPSGQYRKPSSNSKLLELGWNEQNFSSFEKALRKTCEWFVKNYHISRGI